MKGKFSMAKSQSRPAKLLKAKTKPKKSWADRRLDWKKAKLNASVKRTEAKSKQSSIKTIAQEIGSTMRSAITSKAGTEIYQSSKYQSPVKNGLDIYNGIINGNPNTGESGDKQEGSTTDLGSSSGSFGGG